MWMTTTEISSDREISFFKFLVLSFYISFNLQHVISTMSSPKSDMAKLTNELAGIWCSQAFPQFSNNQHSFLAKRFATTIINNFRKWILPKTEPSTVCHVVAMPHPCWSHIKRWHSHQLRRHGRVARIWLRSEADWIHRLRSEAD